MALMQEPTAEQTMEFIRLYRLMRPLDLIRKATKLSENQTQKIIRERKLSRPKVQAVRHQSKKLYEEPAPITKEDDIFIEAKKILIHLGFKKREIEQMHMDEIFSRANFHLHKHGMEQLGKKPEWLWGKK